MSTKEAFQAREAACKTAADFAALAQEASGADPDYARALLERAEAQCQMPADYIAAAQGAAAVGLAQYALDLYGQAEDACFDALETAALGASLARTGTDPAKGRALLEAAGAQAKQPAEILTVAGYAREALGDEALAASLLARVESKIKGLADYLGLAKTLSAQGAADQARDFYKKAARHLDGLDDTVAYAKGYLEVFADPTAARKILEDAETDCQFPKDFAALAAGFKSLFDDGGKVGELMDQAGEFAMSGAEHLDLARGYWDLLQDRPKAVAAFAKALPDLNDKTQLLELGGYVASRVQDGGLAKRFYAKAEEKMSGAAERLKLAESVIKDTGDKTLAAAIYARAADSLTQPNDLMSVAANVADQLGDREQAATIYRKAMAAMGDFGQYARLLDAVDAKLADRDFAREILERARALASGSPALLDLAERAIASLADRDLARVLLAGAEEQVTSVGEMKAVVAAVQQHFGDDPDWIAQTRDKLVRREANQAKYAVFQEREKGADSAIKILKLADAAMAELDDRFYARKLLTDAQKRLDGEDFDFSKLRKLVEGASRHLGDGDWAARLLKDAAARVQGFAGLAAVAETAVELLPDRAQAQALVRELLDGYEQGLASPSAYDLSKLAEARGRLLGDRDTAGADLDRAAELAQGHFGFAELARVARALGLQERARALGERAAAACTTAAQAGQLVVRLIDNGVPREQVRGLYTAIQPRLPAGAERVQWADAIVDLFADRDWAYRELQALAAASPASASVAIARQARRRAAHA